MRIDIDGVAELAVSREIAERDSMFEKGGERHYFSVGLSNIYAISNVCQIRQGVVSGLARIRDVLDFGCGYGRVARFLRALFPDGRVWVTDLDEKGVEFCVGALGCEAIVGALQAESMDLIWLGSVLTHLDPEAARLLIDRLTTALRPGGLLIFTTQGRYSRERARSFDWSRIDQTPWLVYNLNKADFDRVCSDYDLSGYGYIDYPGQSGYGISIVRPDWYEMYCGSKGLRTIGIQERGCDNHQDILSFMRTDIVDPGSTPFWEQAVRFLES